ncbi:MAG: PHP domain-containing protein [Chloroflexota bacterium]
MSQVDLHLHSTASDGRFSPEEIVRLAAGRGLTIIALADHDTADGIVPALAAAEAFPELRVIPAVEISTDIPSGEIHVLGYFIDLTDQELAASLKRFRHSREERAGGMVAKLRNLGIRIELERVREIAGAGSVGRPHLAQAMLEKGYIASLAEAFSKYIGHGGPAYVARDKMAPAEAVRLILGAGGLPVLAHPFTVADPETVTIELKAAGLVGIEAYYGGHSAEQINQLLGLAHKYHLIATGGSDYHGLDDSAEIMMGEVEVPLESAEKLIALAEKTGALYHKENR